MKIQVGCFLISLFSCVGVHASDTWGAESLSGLKPFKVSLVMGGCATELATKVYTDLNRDVELKLRIARILTNAKANFPILLMDVTCLRINIGGQQVGYAIHMQLSLTQYLLVEDTKQHVVAMTWQAVDGQTCSTESCPDDMRSAAKNMTDEFTSDFLKANETK